MHRFDIISYRVPLNFLSVAAVACFGDILCCVFEVVDLSSVLDFIVVAGYCLIFPVFVFMRLVQCFTYRLWLLKN